jgi:hypothetical protein
MVEDDGTSLVAASAVASDVPPPGEKKASPPMAARDKRMLIMAAALVIALGLGGAYISSVSEFAALLLVLGLPIALTLAGWISLADGLRFEDVAMFPDDQAGLLYSIAAVPTAITLSAFLGVVVHRFFLQPDQPVFTLLLGRFFLAFCAVSTLGCLFVSCRHYLLCWRHRR